MLFLKLSELLGIGVDKIIEQVNNVVDDNTYNKEERAENEIRLKELEYRSEELDRQDLQREQEFFKSLITLEVQDKADARLTERAALETDDIFVRRFRYYFAIGITFCCFLIISGILIFLILTVKQHFADTILGFVMGTALSTVINYFFGTSYSSTAKDSTIKDLINK